MLRHSIPFKTMNEHTLSTRLIEAQYRLKNNAGKKGGKSLLILVSGIELAGKGESVKQLREWVDPRYLKVKAEPALMLCNEQTFWQPYVNFIPREGQIAIMFSNWYSDLLTTAMQASKPLNDTLFEAYVENMRAFEQDLKNNHVHVIKVWFDLSWKALQKRLDHIDTAERQWHKLHGLDWRDKRQYDTLQKLRQRFSSDWIVIDGEHKKQRNQIFAQNVLHALKQPLKPDPLKPQQSKAGQSSEIPTCLLQPEQKQLEKAIYKKKLKKLTQKVTNALRLKSRKVILVFEGMDAAGKGGGIKRIIKRLDPREYDIFSISAPEQYELSHPYLWRFWTKLQNDHSIRIFDRSWYGRVLVERIEKLTLAPDWQRAYAEINRFEKDLVDSQTVVIKVWLAISKEEQIQRFHNREKTPYKRFKITEDDWRNREKWDDYLLAAADMFALTDTAQAPWHIIATDDKYSARIQLMKTVLKQLKAH